MIGKTIHHYKILEKLGTGGMGTVYRARDTRLDRFVALKFLAPHLSRTEEIKKRFIHEAKAASALDHSNICSIYEISETEEGELFIAMACYEGVSLKEKIENERLSVEEAVEIAVQVMEGLAKAHSKNIVHRDIKPANVLVTEEKQVKIVDFGLAKLAGRTVLTQEGSTLGTVAYMSPEQSEGKEVDHRADIWAVGVMLYEMLTGCRPFKGDYEQAVIYSIMNEDPEPVEKLNPDVPTELQNIVNRALKKNMESRYSSSAKMLKDLKGYQNARKAAELGTFDFQTFLRRIRKPRIAVPVLATTLLIIFASVWFFGRQAKIDRARNEMLPEVKRLVESSWRDYTEAYELAEKAEKHIPNDPELAALFSKSSLNININTDPPGADVYMKKYSSPESEWKHIGISPIKSVRVPIGIFRWKMEKEGYETVLAVASSWDISIAGKDLLVANDLKRVLDKKGSISPEMVRVAGLKTPVGVFEDFFIDRNEVTNKDYKKFIDSEGYNNKTYWAHEFIYEGKVLSREEAMARFVDQTGRTGPATWQAGDYPEGEDNYPVSGVSWYEAAAYAVFAGKSLPTGHHWGLARGEYTSLIQWPQLGGFAIFAPFSNFNGKGPVEAGSLPGITSYGANDMAGNVREWCWNKAPAGKLIRGGAWNDNTYRFSDFAGAPAFDRSSTNGFRCVLYPNPEKIQGPAFEVINFRKTMDFYKEKPVSDAIFQVYKEQFSYDKAPLNTKIESRDESAEEWIHERVTYDAAYNNERIVANLFLPKNATPPYQTVIYFPGSASIFQSSSKDIANYYEFPVFLSFLVKNGRAVLYPVYKGTFERRNDALIPVWMNRNSHQYTDFVIQLVKDLKKSIDFLETREDINSKKLAYYGMSWGGVMSVYISAVENRLKTTIILGGGVDVQKRPEVNQINYLKHVKTPILMLCGKYDSVFPCETSIKPMFDLFGTPEEHKELKLYKTDHIPPRNEYIKEILAWLDKYFGPVK
ncbi:MAG: protein kinase [Acidobacteriota bacterium]